MPDYDLSRLSTRSFEQLIQSIAIALMGAKIVVFGDGPDGGREATFEGKVSYPSPNDPWDGYGVIQAKFRQKSAGTTADGEWAARELRSELKKFYSSKRALRKPDCYILATNVVLSPVTATGSKDKLHTILDDYKVQGLIKAYAIWDYDQIRAFLDSMPHITRTYAAWITPGDVLTEVMGWLGLTRPDFGATISNLLQKELQADHDVHLGQAGYSTDERTPLARVFIDLPARRGSPDQSLDNENGREFADHFIRVGDTRLDARTVAESRKAGRISSHDPEPGRFVLVGGPGQGKSTLGQFIAQLYRASILSCREMDLYPPEVSIPLATIIDEAEKGRCQLPSGRRFPVRIVLNEFATRLSIDGAEGVTTLLEYLTDRIRKRTNTEVLNADLRKWLSQYPWVIILDGLDEVPESSNRAAVLKAVQDFWIDVSDLEADVLILATTRPQGYGRDFSPDHYQHWYLSPLDPERALAYAGKLLPLRISDNERQETVLRRLEMAAKQTDSGRLMRSPLQVTIMSLLVEQSGDPPRHRWHLFREYYEIIYRRETQRDIPAAAILRDHKPDIDALHSLAGYYLQLESERAGSTDARLSDAQFAALVHYRLVNEGYEGRVLAELSHKITIAAMHRLVFLVGLEAGVVGFEIRSLQEFMAAECLMSAPDECVRMRLLAIASSTHWQNVFLFCVGKMLSEREYLRDVALSICSELNDPHIDQVHSSVRLGSTLATEVLEETPVGRHPAFRRALAREAFRLLDYPLFSDQIRLARIYDSDLHSVFSDALHQRASRVQTSDCVGAWLVILGLINQGQVWAQSLAEEVWPSDQAVAIEILGLFELFPEELDSPWFRKRLVDVLGESGYLATRPLAGVIRWLEHVGGAVSIEDNSITRVIDSISDTRQDNNIELSVFDSGNLRIHVSSMISARNWLRDANGNDASMCKDWNLFFGASRFSMHPGAMTLAETLEAFADLADSGVLSVSEMATATRYGELPWPLAECILSCFDTGDMRRLARLARDGALGDTADWLAGESRFAAEGIDHKDIVALRGDLPFDASISQAGFPYKGTGMWVTHTNANDLLETLLASFEEATVDATRRLLAGWLLFAIPAWAHEAGAKGTMLLPVQVRELLEFSNSAVRAVDVVMSQETLMERFGEWNTLLVEISRKLDMQSLWRQYAFRFENEITFGTLFESHGDRVRNWIIAALAGVCYGSAQDELLCILALLACQGRKIPSVPILDQNRYVGSVFEGSVILVRLAQGGLVGSEIKPLAEAIIRMSESSPAFVGVVVKILSDCEAAVGTKVDLLILLKDGVCRSLWEGRAKIDYLLRNLAQGRQSRLGDPCEVHRLALPNILAFNN